MLSPDVANIIIPLHIITGSDHSSGFFGHGKKRVLKDVINDPVARQLLMAVGENITLEEDVESDMRTFVISKIYGDSTSVTWTGKVIKMSDFHRTIIHYNTTSRGQILLRIFRNITTCWITLLHQ